MKKGGLGNRSAVQLAPSAFLASAASSSDLVHRILPPLLQSAPLSYVEDAVVSWSQGHNQPLPVGTASYRQKTWDAPRVSASAFALLDSAPNAASTVRFLAASIYYSLELG